MKELTPQQRIAAFWKDYERFSKTWTLECTLVMHFGRNQELLLPGGEPYRRANFGYDPCLPQEDHPDYAFFELFVQSAEAIIEAQTPERGEGYLDQRLCGYPAGRRADVPTLNLGWSQPFQRIEGSEELRDGLIAQLKEATLNGNLPALPLRRSA